MANIKKRCSILRAELKSRMGYASISAIIVAVILIIIKNSAMPNADERITLAVAVAYVVATFAAQLAADTICYITTGFSMQNIKAWQGILNTVLSIALTGIALSSIDATCADGIFTLEYGDTTSPAQIAISNFLLAAIATATSASFARSSEQRRRRTEIDQECELINEGIARRHADKGNKTGLIIMNQIVKIDSGEDGNDVEIAVCDMIYARKTDTRHVTIVYKPGIKTCRLTIEGNINELLHSCFGNHHQVMRCHKDYIVNTDRITHVQSLGCDCYELKLRGTKHAIPVSDKYRQLIYDTLTAK